MKKARYFEWIAGESAGEVERLESITELDGEYFYNFDDGEVCNLRYIAPMTSDPSALANKFMVEVEKNSKWTCEKISTTTRKLDNGTDEVVEIPPIEDIVQASGQECTIEHSKLGQIKLIPPAHQVMLYTELPSIQDYLVEEEEATAEETSVKEADPVVNEVHAAPEIKQVEQSVPVEETATITIPAYEPYSVQPVQQSDPVSVLVSTCKKHATDIDLTISIDLPAKSIYDIAANEFDDGSDKFIDNVIADIDVNMILEELRTALKTAYTSESEEK